MANYLLVTRLPETILNDARDLRALLTDPARCGYLEAQVVQLLDGEATGDSIRAALTDLAARTGPDDTAVVFFSGHGVHEPAPTNLKPETWNLEPRQYILPYDCDPADLPGTAIVSDEMTAFPPHRIFLDPRCS